MLDYTLSGAPGSDLFGVDGQGTSPSSVSGALPWLHYRLSRRNSAHDRTATMTNYLKDSEMAVDIYIDFIVTCGM